MVLQAGPTMRHDTFDSVLVYADALCLCDFAPFAAAHRAFIA
jgi:hypothetical protein